MATINVTDGTFDGEVLKSDIPVLLDFWAPWCGPCKMIGPVLEELSEEFAGKIKIVKVNVDDNPETPTKYGVRGIPMLLIFKDGKVVSTKTGALPKGQLSTWIASVL